MPAKRPPGVTFVYDCGHDWFWSHLWPGKQGDWVRIYRARCPNCQRPATPCDQTRPQTK